MLFDADGKIKKYARDLAHHMFLSMIEITLFLHGSVLPA